MGMSKKDLRELIVASLEEQGFRVLGRSILPPPGMDKDGVRNLHSVAVQHRRATAKSALAPHEDRLCQRVASGSELVPARVSPQLREVRTGTDDELLFRYASLHWSIPVSSGYGRRMRFLIVDDQNDKLIGILGLGDPVFCLSGRDEWIGWSAEARKKRLRCVLDAFVLGAVPPYSFLLCGKLIAMLATSNEVREAFRSKYVGTQSLISGERSTGELALITTTSALGKSSLYNRVRYNGYPLMHRAGFTRGSGEFHFSNGVYGAISRYAEEHCVASAKKTSWGTGFRNRREVVKKCLADIGLSTEWLYHGVQREIFVAPLAHNARDFLQCKQDGLLPLDLPPSDLAEAFRDRWLVPRSKRDERYVSWDPQDWRLW